MTRPLSLKAFLALYLSSQLIGALGSARNVLGFASTGKQVGGFIFLGLVVAAFVWLGFKIFAGRNWARIVFAAIYGGGLLVAVLPHAKQYPSPDQAVIYWLNCILQGAAVVASFSPSSNAWVRFHRGQGTVQQSVPPDASVPAALRQKRG